jgi:hypothetical protein
MAKITDLDILNNKPKKKFLDLIIAHPEDIKQIKKISIEEQVGKDHGASNVEGKNNINSDMTLTLGYKQDIDPPSSSDNTDFKNIKDLPSEIAPTCLTTELKSPIQTEHKLNTNWTQTGHKTGHKLDTSKNAETQTGHKLDTEPNTELDTNWTQTGHKLDTKQGVNQGVKQEGTKVIKQTQNSSKVGEKANFSTLVGLQKRAVIFIYNECKNARSKTTKNLSMDYIISALSVPPGSVKTTFKRLEEKGFITRGAFKNGRCGWTSYSLPDFLFQELLQYETEHKLNTNWTQTGHKLGSEPNTEPNTSPPVVSSYVYDNNTTRNNISSRLEYESEDEQTQEQAKLEVQPKEQRKIAVLPKDWEAIDLFDLENIGFSKSHLVQIYREYQVNENFALTAEMIQDSVYAFAFDLAYNNVDKKFRLPAAAILTTLLKQGRPYSCITPDRFFNPRLLALKKHAEMMKEHEGKELEILETVKRTGYGIWLSELSEDEIWSMHPSGNIVVENEIPAKKAVRWAEARRVAEKYFEAEIWPHRKAGLLAKIAKREKNKSE